MDPILNCLLGVCCPPDSAQQLETATKFFMEYAGLAHGHAADAAACMLKHFDLAEKGTLQPLKDSIARLARG